MPKEFGRQPAAVDLYAAKLTIAVAADKVGCSAPHLNRAVHGRCLPNEQVLEGLPKLLDKPLRKLFAPEVLAAVRDRRKAGAR